MNVASALKRLRPGHSFTLEGDTLAGLSWIGTPPTPVTQPELDDMLAVLAEEQASTAYRALRAAEYPSLGDQMDDLFKMGVFSAAMAARIQAVKDKYPKPSAL